MPDLSEENQMGIHDGLKIPRFAGCLVMKKAALPAGHQRFVIRRQLRVHVCAAVFVGCR